MSKVSHPVFKVSNTSANRVAWNKEHETQLQSLVERHQGRNWKKIAEEMQRIFNCPELSAKKCRERWCNCANPELNKTALTEVEELFLLFYHYEYKNKWTMISQHLPNRNSTKLKNNFSSFIRKMCRKIYIDDRTSVSSMLAYVQILYAIILIHDMIITGKDYDKVELLAPVHIYEHIREKKITSEQCLDYIKKITESMLDKYRVLEALKKLNKMEDVKGFLFKLMPLIKARYKPNDVIADSPLVGLIESCINDIFPAPKIKDEPVKEIEAEKEIVQAKELPSAPLVKDIGYVPYQQSANFYESDSLYLPEIPGTNFPSLHSPLQFNNDIGIPIPTFASPAFQASLQSTQSNYGNTLLSPTCFPSIPILKSPTEFFMLQLQSQTPDVNLQHRTSDFTAFTNKYV